MFNVQDFIASCQQFVGAPDGTRRVLDLVRSVVGDAQGIKSAIVPGGDHVVDAARPVAVRARPVLPGT